MDSGCLEHCLQGCGGELWENNHTLTVCMAGPVLSTLHLLVHSVLHNTKKQVSLSPLYRGGN